MKANWKPNFFLIWAGQALSDFTSSVLQFAVVWYLTDVTGSPLVLSAAMLAGFLPKALIGPFAGVAIDRYNRKIVMVVSDAFIAAASLPLVFGGGTGMPIWLIMAVLVLRSIGSAFHQPCLQAVTPQIVPREMLARCAGYSQAVQSVSSLLSPGVAAVLYGAWGLKEFVYLDIGGAAAAIICLLFAHIPRLMAAEKKRPRVLQEAMEGFRLLRAKKGLFGLVSVNLLYVAAMMPISAYFPLMCLSYFGGTSMDAGLVEMLFSAGLLAGSLLLGLTGGFRDKMHTILFSCLLMGACLLTGGMLPPQGLAAFAAVAFFMGICGPTFWGSQTAILQQSFPDAVLGRVLALSNSIRMFATPLSLLSSSLLAERYGPQSWFITGGILILIVAALCFFIRPIRQCDPSRAETTKAAE